MWHPGEKYVYWTDIPTGRMFRYNPATGAHEQFYEGEVVGGFTIQEDGSLLLFMANGAIAIWRDGNLRYINEENPNERETRFNDVIADPVGRVFCGTMSTANRLGWLYRLDPNGRLTQLLDDIHISNGMRFTPYRNQMYYTDTPKREIYLFDYNQNTGDMINQRVFVRTPEDQGMPDGMTMDAEGYIWSACWDGSCLVRYPPDGREERRIEFPTKKVSSVTFGGEDFTDMYVTSAGGDNKVEEGSGAEALFRINVGIRGVPELTSRIGSGEMIA